MEEVRAFPVLVEFSGKTAPKSVLKTSVIPLPRLSTDPGRLIYARASGCPLLYRQIRVSTVAAGNFAPAAFWSLAPRSTTEATDQ